MQCLPGLQMPKELGHSHLVLVTWSLGHSHSSGITPLCPGSPLATWLCHCTIAWLSSNTWQEQNVPIQTLLAKLEILLPYFGEAEFLNR